jgi:coenzyme PQQ precursor peptide PqqA
MGCATKPAGVYHAADQETKEGPMAWKTPKIIEIPVGAEINSYACAEMK